MNALKTDGEPWKSARNWPDDAKKVYERFDCGLEDLTVGEEEEVFAWWKQNTKTKKGDKGPKGAFLSDPTDWVNGQVEKALAALSHSLGLAEYQPAEKEKAKKGAAREVRVEDFMDTEAAEAGEGEAEEEEREAAADGEEEEEEGAGAAAARGARAAPRPSAAAAGRLAEGSQQPPYQLVFNRQPAAGTVAEVLYRMSIPTRDFRSGVIVGDTLADPEGEGDDRIYAIVEEILRMSGGVRPACIVGDNPFNCLWDPVVSTNPTHPPTNRSYNVACYWVALTLI